MSRSKKKDQSKGTLPPQWMSSPIYLELDPKPDLSVCYALADIYFNNVEEKYKTDTILKIRKEAEERGEPVRIPRPFVITRPHKVQHLQAIWKLLGFIYTDIECEDMLLESDNRKDPYLTFPAFLEIFSTCCPESKYSNELLNAFTELDIEQKGYITLKQLGYYMTSLVEKMTRENAWGIEVMPKEEIDAFAALAGVDGDLNTKIFYKDIVEKLVESIRAKSSGKRKNKIKKK
mmetsp:Transcript_29977/g.52615  ORF Transcript_29977/g.52615 Transcript_29977/m.52615 type:complete len:233 (+) Transcript_29977:74-772(+)